MSVTMFRAVTVFVSGYVWGCDSVTSVALFRAVTVFVSGYV